VTWATLGLPRLTLHVNTATGSDANSGTSAAPLATVGEAMSILALCGGGTVVLTAPVGDPVTGMLTYTKAHPITIRAATTAYWDASGASACLWVYGLGAVTIEGIDFTGGTAAGVLLGRSTAVSGSGVLVATDCSMHDSAGSGFATQGVWTSASLTGCDSSDNGVDGFGAHATAGTPTITLTTCTGSGNADEWASPHETVTMNVVGGSSSGNVHCALAAADSAALNVTDFISIGDYTGVRTNSEGVISYIDATTSGSLTNVSVTDSPGAPGVIVKAGASVSISGLTSTGNNGADNYAAA
jgi:hypothetical protein